MKNVRLTFGLDRTLFFFFLAFMERGGGTPPQPRQGVITENYDMLPRAGGKMSDFEEVVCLVRASHLP